VISRAPPAAPRARRRFLTVLNRMGVLLEAAGTD
jgi:hypothetical protein